MIAMAGSAGTGKSALAQRLAENLPAVVINKDTVRAAIFPADEIENSATQDDLVMSLIYQAAAYLIHKGRSVIIDGRPFLKKSQRTDLKKAAYAAGAELRIIRCKASDDVVKARLQQDTRTGNHPTMNRSYDLHLQQKADYEPIEEPHLTLNTNAPLEDLVRLAMEWLKTPITYTH